MISDNIFPELPDSSRIWIYQSSVAFTDSESSEISMHIKNFVSEWDSHGKEVKSDGILLHNRFIVLVVDESSLAVSGCSIDSSVSLIKTIEKNYGTDMFDRMRVALSSKESVEVQLINIQELDYSQFKDHYYFDNTITSLGELRNSWKKPISDGWLSRFVTT